MGKYLFYLLPLLNKNRLLILGDISQALGCVLFRIAFTDHPFQDGNNLQILNGVYTIPSSSPYSSRVHALIQACLTPDPAERPSAAAVLQLIARAREVVQKLC